MAAGVSCAGKYYAPWHDNSPTPSREVIRILWDYEKEMVVDSGICTLFDTSWTYCYDGITVTGWWVLRYPHASPHYLLEAEVPEMVRLAVLVSE